MKRTAIAIAILAVMVMVGAGCKKKATTVNPPPITNTPETINTNADRTITTNTNAGVNSNPNANTNSPINTNASVTNLTAHLSIMDDVFVPTSLTVKRGTKVTWTHNGSSSHQVVWDTSGPSDSQLLANGMQYEYTFSQTGTFRYHCSFHGTMLGTVNVTD